MAKSIRLDRYLSNTGVGTRSEVKMFIRQGLVAVDGKVAGDPSMKVMTEGCDVRFNGEEVVYSEFEYLMLNKPQGIVSATNDIREKTVIDLIGHPKAKHLFPVGRLDKDTTGLLLLTNDGQLAHELLSPRKHVDKTYEVLVNKKVEQDTVDAFFKGIELDDGYVTMPALLDIIEYPEEGTYVRITIREGKFHQIKRMFAGVGMEVLSLNRVSMGTLVLDPKLERGDYRKLTHNELKCLKDR